MKLNQISIRFIVLTLSVLCLISLCRNGAMAKETVTVNLISAPFGGSSYLWGVALEDILRKAGSPVLVAHSETPGASYNIMKLDKSPADRANTLIVSGPGLITMANKAMKPFKKAMGQDLMPISFLSASATWFVTRDPSLKQYSDLKGKKVALGNKQQPSWSSVPMMEFGGAGLKPKDMDLLFLGHAEGATAFKDRLVDATVAGAFVNPISKKFVLAPFFQELIATEKTINYIGPGKEVLAVTEKNTGLPFPAMTFKKGQLPGLDRSITVAMQLGGFYAHTDFPADQIYQITRQIILNVDKFGEYHAMGKILSKELLCWGMTRGSVHPGAYRAYREYGLLD